MDVEEEAGMLPQNNVFGCLNWKEATKQKYLLTEFVLLHTVVHRHSLGDQLVWGTSRKPHPGHMDEDAENLDEDLVHWTFRYLQRVGSERDLNVKL